MNFFPLISRLQRLPLKHARIEHDRLLSLSGDDFLKDQEERRWAIYRYHQARNNFYKTFLSARSIKNWADIPILEKSDIQKPLRDILSIDYSMNGVYRNNTSGSTGKPFHFAKDLFSHAMTWDYIIRQYKDLELEYGESLQARFFGIPLTRSKYLKEKVKDFFSARVRFPVFDLSDRKLEEYLTKFSRHKFKYVYGYTSSLVLFAQFIKRRSQVLSELCPSLKWCIVTSEVCSPADKELLRDAFGVPVINEYGAAELDIIAFENKHEDWVLNEENLYIEILGADGKPVAEGEKGRVIVTSLYNRAMPFIRYNLGDIITLKPGSKNQRRVIDSVEGRINDVAVLPSGKKSPGLTFYYISKSLLEQGGFVREFTIKQLALDHFHFEYVAVSELGNAQKEKVVKMMEIYLEKGLRATFEKKEKIERSGAGKFKHFQSFLTVT